MQAFAHNGNDVAFWGTQDHPELLAAPLKGKPSAEVILRNSVKHRRGQIKMVTLLLAQGFTPPYCRFPKEHWNWIEHVRDQCR